MKMHYKNLSLVDIEEYIPGIGWVKEMWMDIKEWEDYYQISTFGRVKSLPHPKKGNWGNTVITKKRILSPGMAKNGYLRVQLCKDGIQTSSYIHRLVAVHFVQNLYNKPEINHKKGVKTDNRKHRLEWVTKKEQSRHALRTGLIKNIAENHNWAKLTNEQALKIFHSNLSVPKLAKLYNISQSNIYDIKRGMGWRSVTGKKKPDRQHLSKELVLKVFKANMSYSELAKKYKIPYYQVGMIKRGDSWSGLTGKINK
jgi:Mor family transcriptional regulator